MFNPVSIIAILCITILVVVALCLGYDGIILAGSLTIIAGLGGYSVKRKKSKTHTDYWR